MFGLFYVVWSAISHVGYRFKQIIHDSGAHVDKRTNTYMGFDGRLRDASNGKKVFWTVDQNGDEVLLDKPGHVYRNISRENISKSFEKAKRTPGNETVYVTGQRRKIRYKDENGNEKYANGMIFKDLETGTEFASRRIPVWYSDLRGEQIEFYVRARDPYYLVRITDEQRKIEQTKERNGKYSWTKFPNDEKQFIQSFNNEPVTLCGKKSSLFTFSR